MPDDRDRPLTEAEKIYVAALSELRDGEEVDVEALCRLHPHQAEALRRVHATWAQARSLIDHLLPSPSLSERIETVYGDDADPKITLEQDEPESGEEFSWDVVRRLGERQGAFGRYRVKGEVARGGQGAVLRVWDEDLRRNLAMKVILGKGEAEATGETPEVDSRTLGRFLEEAQVTGQLDHPGVVPVHELGLDSEGRVYFTMKLVKGRTLGEIFDLVHRGEEGWTVTRALGVMLRVCEAMSYAHSKGVIHRDLKPGNVMVGRFGEVYVMDWGLAHVLGEEDRKDIRIKPMMTTTSFHSERRDRAHDTPDSPLVTMDGDVVGTPAYMSPEQAMGELGELGPHSDVYSVGAMLYHLLTGQMPYVTPGGKWNNYAVWQRVQEGPPKKLSEFSERVPVELEAVCEKAMARGLSDRYPSLAEFADDVRAFLEGRVVRAHATGALVEFRKWVARNRSTVTAAVAVLALAVAVLITAVVAAKNETIAGQQQELQNRLANSHMQLADRAAQRGDGHAVLNSLREAEEAGYHDPLEIAWRRADALIVTYQYEEALAELEALCERKDLGEHAGAIYLRRGHLLLYTWDESTEGLEWTQRAIETGLSPADHELAMSYTAGTFREAMEHCEGALEEEPFNYLANTHLLSLLVFTGDFENAARQALAIEKLFPDDPTPVVYQVLRSALEGKLEIDALEDQAVVDRLGEDNVRVLRGIAETFHALMPYLKGEKERIPSMLEITSMFQPMLSGLQGENQPSHRRFNLVGTAAMPLLRDSFRPTLAAVLNLLIQGNPQADTVLRLLLQTEGEPLIEHFFGDQYTGFEHDDWVATLERVAEMNGDSIIWLALAYYLMLELDSAGDRPAMVAMMRDAEHAFRRAYEAPSILPGIPDIAGTMMVYSQALLGCFGWGLSDPEMLESAHRNLEKMVHTEGLDPMYRHYLQISSTQLGRPDLSLLLWRQAMREHPDSREVQQKLASAALGVGHWAEAIEIADGTLEEDASDEEALEIRAAALERGREWFETEGQSRVNESSEDD